ncbi:MAG: hypothetical protein D3913_04370 [Candidatus Electrothrix sp. LOE1_4_5]|nr:hypothetical protein [Candidatus Electrothrix gigas]
MNLINERLRIVLIYLAFISGITPFNYFNINVEHFPYGILIALFTFSITWRALFFLIGIVTFYLLSVAYYKAIGLDPSLSYLIQTLNFISPLLFYHKSKHHLIRIARNVFWIYIIIGCMQFLHLLVPLEPIFDLFISRFSGKPLAGYRGVTMLETEPARASFQLLFLYFISEGQQEKEDIKKTITLILAQIFLICSTTGIFLTACLLIIKYWKEIIAKVNLITLTVITIIAVIGYQYALENPKIKIFYDEITHYGIEGGYNALAATSGGRFLAATATISNIIQWPLGYGADPEFFSKNTDEIDQYSIAGYRTWVSSRPISAILNFLYVYGLVITCFLVLLILSMNRGKKVSILTLGILMIGTLYSPPGTAVLLIALLISFKGKGVTS